MSKKKNLNVLSLFDGIGCSRLALNKCSNIKINKYFYSEIDKNCIKLTEKKFPNDIFLGEKTNGELASHFASSDVFVFPSKTDTFGIVVLESLNCGTPVAAYPVPGPKDILGGTNIDTLDYDLKASALKALKVSRQDCLDFAKKYSWEETAKIFFENISPNY